MEIVRRRRRRRRQNNIFFFKSTIIIIIHIENMIKVLKNIRKYVVCWYIFDSTLFRRPES